jgi:hypothetical protein
MMKGQSHVPAAVPQGKRAHPIEGWVGPRAGLDVVVTSKSLAPVGNQTPVVQLTA